MIFLALPFLALFAYIAWRSFGTALAIFFFLLPTYLIRFHIGPLPTTFLELMFIVLFGVWMVREIRKWRNGEMTIKQFPSFLISLFRNFKYRSLIIAITLFITGATISVFTAIDFRAALGEWRAFYIEPMMMFIMIVGMNKKQLEIRYLKLDIILFALILCGLLTSLFAIYQHFTGFFVPHSFWANRATYRVTGWYGYPNAVGLFLAPLVPLAMYLIQDTWKKIHNDSATSTVRNWTLDIRHFLKIENCKLKIILIFSLITLPASFAAILFAKGAGPIIGVAVGIGLLLLYYHRTRIPALILGALAVIAVFFILPANNPIRTELLAEDRSGHIRRDMWAETTEYLVEHPIVGTGMASYDERIAPYRIDKTIEVFSLPHNLFLSIWVNTGLIGIFGFVWIIVWFYRVGLIHVSCNTHHVTHTIENLKPKTYHLTPYLISSMTVLLVTGLVDTPYIKNDLSMFFWLLIALMIITTNQTLSPRPHEVGR